MAQITTCISIDVVRSNRAQAITAKQSDTNSRFLKITLLNDGTPLIVDALSTVTINALRSDGEANAFEGTVNADGTVTVPLSNWMLALDGTVKCDISVVDADERKLTSTMFQVLVEKIAYSGTAIADDDPSLLTEILSDISETKAGLSTCRLYSTVSGTALSLDDCDTMPLRALSIKGNTLIAPANIYGVKDGETVTRNSITMNETYSYETSESTCNPTTPILIPVIENYKENTRYSISAGIDGMGMGGDVCYYTVKITYTDATTDSFTPIEELYEEGFYYAGYEFRYQFTTDAEKTVQKIEIASFHTAASSVGGSGAVTAKNIQIEEGAIGHEYTTNSEPLNLSTENPVVSVGSDSVTLPLTLRAQGITRDEILMSGGVVQHIQRVNTSAGDVLQTPVTTDISDTDTGIALLALATSYPDTTIALTATGQNGTLSVTYYRNLAIAYNKDIQNLTNAVIALGGTV